MRCSSNCLLVFCFALLVTICALRVNADVPNAKTSSIANNSNSIPSGRTETPAHSMLDQMGKIEQPVSDNTVRNWRNELSNQNTSSERAAQLHIFIGEYKLSHDEQPEQAIAEFKQAQSSVAEGSDAYRLANYDQAIAIFQEGAYTEAVDKFQAVLKAPTVPGAYDVNLASSWLRHAFACSGYHLHHEKLGIPEPPRLDPYCAAASLAVSLKSMGMPWSRDILTQSMRITGRGSSSVDISDTCKRMNLHVNTVTVDDTGLMELPLPVIAHVEHDHFVSVIAASKSGVSYVCSDCGAWPGGRVDLTWKQWHALDADAYQVVTKPNSEWDRVLTSMNPSSALQPANTLASSGSISGLHLASMVGQINLIAAMIKGHVILDEQPYAINCTQVTGASKCLSQVQCPLDVHCHTRTNDPVNLATGEEEYTPDADITVYNPTGPSVEWSRIYGSMRPENASVDTMYQYEDFGYGWSNSYNYFIQDPSVMTPVGFQEMYPGVGLQIRPSGYDPPISSNWEVYQFVGGVLQTSPIAQGAFLTSNNGWQVNNVYPWLQFGVPSTGVGGNYYEVKTTIGSFLVYVATTQTNYILSQGANPQQATIFPNAAPATPSGTNTWDVVLGSTVVASQANPRGWMYADYKGQLTNGSSLVTLIPPLNATVSSGYQLRLSGGTNSTLFSVVASGITLNTSAPQTDTKYFVYPDGSRVPITTPSVPTASNPVVQCTVPSGTPLAVEWDYDSTTPFGRYKVTLSGRTTMRFNAASSALWRSNTNTTPTIIYPVSTITDSVGNPLNINYGDNCTEGFPLIASLSGSSGTLLTVAHDPNSGAVTSVTDKDGRTVQYHTSTTVSDYNSGDYMTYPSLAYLDQVSQILPAGASSPYPMRYAYGYTTGMTDGSYTYHVVNKITVPQPPGGSSSTSTATIAYGLAYPGGTINNLVSSVTDGNGNTSTYAVVDGASTSVLVTDKNGNSVDAYTVQFDPNMSETLRMDGNGTVVSSQSYNDPLSTYAASSTTDGNGYSIIAPGTSQSFKAITDNSNFGTGNQNDWQITNSITNQPIDSASIGSGYPSTGVNGWKVNLTNVNFPVNGYTVILTPPAGTSAQSNLVIRLRLNDGGLYLISPTFAVGASNIGTTSYTYDKFGNVTSETSPRGTVTNYTYDYSHYPLGQLTEVQEGTKTPTTYVYQSASPYLLQNVYGALPGDSSGGSQNTSHLLMNYTYDTLGNVTQIQSVGPNSTPVLYGGTLASSNHYTVTTNTYAGGASEALGEALTVSISGYAGSGAFTNATTTYTYDSRNNVTSVTDASGNITCYGDTTSAHANGYNVADQLLQVNYPKTGQSGTGNTTLSTTYEYPGGLPLTVTLNDESGNLLRKSTYSYGAEGESLSSTVRYTPTGTDVTTENTAYDGAYRVANVTQHMTAGDAGQTTSYSYYPVGQFGAGRLKQVVNPGGDTINYTSYDADGDVLSRTDGNGAVTNYTYADPESLCTAVTYPSNSAMNVAIAYDQYGRASTISDGAASNYTNNYDYLDDLLSQSTTYYGIPNGSNPTYLPTQTISYTYKPDGDLATMKTPTSATSYAYSYDGLSRMTGLTNPLSYAFSWTYQANGLPTAQTLKNASSTTILNTIMAYNARGLMTELQHKNGSGTVLAQFGGTASPSWMTYDAAQNRLSDPITFSAIKSTSFTNSYSYDGRDELASEAIPLTSAVNNSFGYDVAGNPTTRRGSSVTYNSDNQINATGYVYDGNGNPTTYYGTSKHMTFDQENRMLTNTNGSTTNIINGYRSDGLRAWKQNSAGTRTYFLYDQSGRIVCELTSVGAVQAEDTFGPLGLVERSGSGNAIGLGFFGFDPSGNQVLRLTSTGSVSTSILFDSYGNSVATSGSTATYPFGFGGEFGDYTDTETGFVLCQHRFYDPIKCRWINRDPIGMEGGMNLYEYSGDDPVGETDPSGFDKIYVTYAPGNGQPTQYMIGDIPDGHNIDRNIDDAIEFSKDSSNGNLEKGWYCKVNYSSGGPNDWGKNFNLYPRGVHLKTPLSDQRRLAANFNFGAIGAALGYSSSTLLNVANVLANFKHPQDEQDAIQYGYWYYYATHPNEAKINSVAVPTGFKWGFVRERSKP